ncbi:STAS domain-containing protein [Streptomyces spectabilis]|uniref:STAS domain-containing protein n=1 Tax=Streptomyces spectabilis TaxID=68270 RepID=A0A516R0Y4_STRST|nr:STAS domain-containing protein [Streptomyces spectabilis]QDQ09317.1 STAS domain-containing protein [Streptomyces spectabilis]
MSPHPDRPESADQPTLPALFDDCRLVRARGELDLTTVEPLTQALRQARAGHGRRCLIVDLREVTFMDGVVLEPLNEAWADCRARHGWLRVVYTRSTTRLVFRAGGMTDRFPRYASAQDAWHGTAARPEPGRRAARGGGA